MKEISFMDIINSNKKCKVEHELIDKILEKILFTKERHLKIYETLDEILYTLSRQLNEIELKKVIKNGRWYIEESEDEE